MPGGIVGIMVASILIVAAFKIFKKLSKFLFWVCVVGGAIFLLSAVGILDFLE